MGCFCHGIDAVPEFIEYARRKAAEFQVEHLCTFEVNDIRTRVNDLPGYDIIILGAIGPVFGDYKTTLDKLSGCIKKKGFFIIDDGYVEENNGFEHPRLLTYNSILQQIESAGMKVIENNISEQNEIKELDDCIIEKITQRAYELIEKYPDKKQLFLDYIKCQENENEIMENNIVCSTMIIAEKDW